MKSTITTLALSLLTFLNVSAQKNEFIALFGIIDCFRFAEVQNLFKLHKK